MKNIHLVCNAHIDPVWLWRWEEGCAEALSTFRTAASLLETYPELVFNHNEALLYDWVREYEPALFAHIQELVKAGRWRIIGGWYLQPDCNMPAGESLVRNILEGRRFFSQYFGERPTTAANFDSFGHSRGLVQILKRAGYDSYVICRPDRSRYPFTEQDFLWRGLDGNEIVVHRSDENYNSVFGHVARELEAFLEEKREEPVTLFLWGVGDHGGGPSRKDLDDLRTLSEACKDRGAIRHSSADAYFQEMRETGYTLPVVERGLNPVSEGCYTSQIRVKQAHRRLENELYMTEKMCAEAATSVSFAYPGEALHAARRDLLLSEFHDALPGSGTRLVEEDTLRLLDHGLEIVSRERMKAFVALAASEEPVRPDSSCVLIYNPHPFDIVGSVAFDTALPIQNWDDTFMYPRAEIGGAAVPTQTEMEDSNFRIDWRKRVSVDATLKAGSMTRVDLFFDALPGPDRPTCVELSATESYVFDNGTMRAVIDPKSGTLSEYSVGGRRLLGQGSSALVVRKDIYNSWGLQDNAGEPGQRFTLLSPEEGSLFSGLHERVIPSVRMVEDGPVRTVIEAVLGLGSSKATLRYILPKRGSRLDVEVTVWWQEKDRYLKLEMNCFEGAREYIGQIPFGREALSTGHEVVSQKWSAACGDSDMLAVLNDGCYGSSMNDRVLGVTLLRGAGYSASDCNGKLAMREPRHIDRMDQGERRFQFSLLGGAKQEISRVVDREALTFNERPFALTINPSGAGKPLPVAISIDEPGVMLSCYKQAEDKDGWILRLNEAQGRVTAATLRLQGGKIERTLDFHPFEIKTLRLSQDQLSECDMLEGF